MPLFAIKPFVFRGPRRFIVANPREDLVYIVKILFEKRRVGMDNGVFEARIGLQLQTFYCLLFCFDCWLEISFCLVKPTQVLP